MAKRTMGILFVDTSPHFGGEQRRLYDFINSLNKSRFQPFVVSNDRSDNGLISQFRLMRTVPTFLLQLRFQGGRKGGKLKFFLDALSLRSRIRKWVRDYDIHLVYANTTYAGLLCSIATPKKIPLVFHLRDYDFHQKTINKIVTRSSLTITTSNLIRDNCIRYLHNSSLSQRLVTVYNGFDFEYEKVLKNEYSFRDLYGWDSETFLIVLNGDFLPANRYELFLEALALVRKEHPQIFALIVGRSGSSKHYEYLDGLEKLAYQIGIIGNVAFMEYVVNYLPLIEDCDLVVSVAEKGCYGDYIVQGLASEKRVLVTKDSDFGELFWGISSSYCC